MSASRRAREWGDFQTPPDLAREVCSLLVREGENPGAVVEPTAGSGSFLMAALGAHPAVVKSFALEISPVHVKRLRARLSDRPPGSCEVRAGDFFAEDWDRRLASLPEPILVIGNPPWVTSAEMGLVGGTNLPPRTNADGLVGLDAVTGKSNFDICEWMIRRLLGALNGRRGTLAMLCKSAVARRVLSHAWRDGLAIERSDFHGIDARKHFDAAVDAGLLVCRLEPGSRCTRCSRHQGLEPDDAPREFGFQDGRLVADLAGYAKSKHLVGSERCRWRSGIKHDRAAVMELVRVGAHYENGLGERVSLEPDFVFPMLKSSELNRGVVEPRRHMLVPQRHLGESPEQLRHRAPRTWRYLERHGDLLDARRSSIYRKRPRFSVFGVGPYSFAPFKVAIAGLYKSLRFRVVDPVDGRPVVFGDTDYFIGFERRDDAELVKTLLTSEPAMGLFRAFVFWDAKRPITIELLKRLDLLTLAEEQGQGSRLRALLGRQSDPSPALGEEAVPCER